LHELKRRCRSLERENEDLISRLQSSKELDKTMAKTIQAARNLSGVALSSDSYPDSDDSDDEDEDEDDEGDEDKYQDKGRPKKQKGDRK
jgi:hypothetical protein